MLWQDRECIKHNNGVMSVVSKEKKIVSLKYTRDRLSSVETHFFLLYGKFKKLWSPTTIVYNG